jgi:hypothetical protein
MFLLILVQAQTSVPCTLHYTLYFIIINIHNITFTHSIYNYIPETNHVSRVYSVAAVPYSQLCNV